MASFEDRAQANWGTLADFAGLIQFGGNFRLLTRPEPTNESIDLYGPIEPGRRLIQHARP